MFVNKLANGLKRVYRNVTMQIKWGGGGELDATP